MVSNYWNLSKNLGSEIAKRLVIENRRMEEDESLKAKNQDVYCLISDWRSFQKIAKSNPPHVVSHLFESYYTQVFEMIESVKLGYENHFKSEDLVLITNWVADELFIAVFSKTQNNAIAEAVIFDLGKRLANDVFYSFNNSRASIIYYDIGISFGKNNFVGLTGPLTSLKFTVTGDGAGVSKRMQTLAKELRKNKCIDSSPPLIAMDSELGKRFSERMKIPMLTNVKSEVQDIEGQSVSVFCAHSILTDHQK